MCDFSSIWHNTRSVTVLLTPFVYFLPEKIVQFAKRERKSKLFVKINSNFFSLKVERTRDLTPKKNSNLFYKNALILSFCCVDRTFFLGTKIVFCIFRYAKRWKNPILFFTKPPSPCFLFWWQAKLCIISIFFELIEKMLLSTYLYCITEKKNTMFYG